MPNLAGFNYEANIFKTSLSEKSLMTNNYPYSRAYIYKDAVVISKNVNKGGSR